MKTLYVIIFLIFVTSCKGQKKMESSAIKSDNDIIMIVRKESKIPQDAFQLNMGFDDSPVWIWVKFDDYLSKGKDEFKHIYGIKFWDKEGFLYKAYYEQDRELETDSITDFNNFIINRYPGDKTFQLISKENDTIYLFNVLENKEFRRSFRGKSFQRIPTVKLNNLKQKVSGFDIEINIESKMDNIYLVTTIDSEGIQESKYKSNCQLDDNINFSYFDSTNNRIYLLKKDCFLEKIAE